MIFVCGPYSLREEYQNDLMARFQYSVKIGLNLSMIEQVTQSLNGFDYLIERDSDRNCRPDLSFLFESARVPVVGRVLVHAQPEYGPRSLHDLANTNIHHLLASRDLAVVEIDTQLGLNAVALRSSSAIEALIAKMDVIVSTRLHGLVLALKNGVPVVAVDPIDGGAKLTAQARAVSWPVLFSPTDGVRALEDGLKFCLTADARKLAAQCASVGRLGSLDVETRLLACFDRGPSDLFPLVAD
jgi:hypothetical protein